jgi:hypothetical protein
MSQTPEKVRTIAQFLEVVEHFTKKWFVEEKTWGPWFRGQGNADWKLRPNLYRYPRPVRPIRKLEDELRQEFAVRAPSLSTERPQNSWEWYFLMQHHGAPTRLLDWTESALVALYFAVKNTSERTDAAVWILEPWKLNKHVLHWDEVVSPSASTGMSQRDVDRYYEWLPDRYPDSLKLKKKLPVAIYPTHFSRRISAQRSCFTVHGSDLDGFEHLPKSARPYLQQVVIPNGSVRDVERGLSVAGIDELTVFPDLDGLGRWLAAIMREECQTD